MTGSTHDHEVMPYEGMPYEGMLAETVGIEGHRGEAIPAYLARPLGPGPFPGVVVVHHKHGYDWASREVVRRFAAAGYVAVMPNLHHRAAPGAPAKEAAEAVEAEGGIPDEQCVGDLDGALRLVRRQAYSQGPVGVIGYCSGGRHAYLAAAQLGFDATVVCYGGRIVAAPEELTDKTPIAPVALTADISSPVLGLFGVNDPRPSPEETARVQAELERHGKVHRFVTYEDAGHAFFSVDRPHYRPEAARQGWGEVFAWFDRYLGGGRSDA